MSPLVLLLVNAAVHAHKKCDKDHCYDCFDAVCHAKRKQSFQDCVNCASSVCIFETDCQDKVKPWCSGAGWPTFGSKSDLQQNAEWAKYFLSLYGELPSEYPVALSDFWCFYTDKMSASGVQPPASVGTCPTSAKAPDGEHYDENNACELQWDYKLHPSSCPEPQTSS